MGMKIRFFSDSYKIKRASHRLRGDVTCAALAAQGYDAKILTDWSEVGADTLIIFLKGTHYRSLEWHYLFGILEVKVMTLSLKL